MDRGLEEWFVNRTGGATRQLLPFDRAEYAYGPMLDRPSCVPGSGLAQVQRLTAGLLALRRGEYGEAIHSLSGQSMSSSPAS
jgi:hypothetical protein